MIMMYIKALKVCAILYSYNNHNFDLVIPFTHTNN